MNLFFDNIIFSLQKSGGISVVWFELLQRILKEKEIDSRFLDFPNNNIFRSNLNISDLQLLPNSLDKFPLKIQRYLNPKIDEKGIFHSSYYRIVKNPNIVNITTVHDFTYEYYRKGLPRLIHLSQISQTIKNSKKIICVSQNTKEDLLKFHPEIKEDQIKVIYNGVDDIYRPLQKENKDQINKLIPFASESYILYVGDRRSEYKNFKLSATSCGKTKLPLVIIGGGLLSKNEISLLDNSVGINNYKQLSGINNDQLNLIYNHALCLLYPSLYEGFGIPILEAQRAGCPVISTNFSSIPEVAGKGAILLHEVTEFQIAEMLNLLKKDLKIVAYLKEEGFKNSERFSWDKCYQETKELYKEVYEEYF